MLLSLQNSSVQNLSWYKNDVEISNASSGNFWAKTSGIYKLKGSNAAGCSNWSNAVTVLKHPIPTVNINYTGPSTVCNGDSVVLIASQSNYTAYSWLVNATPIVNANNTSYVAKQSGVYSLKVTDGFGCENKSSTVSIYVNPLPVASIKALGSTVFCSGDSVVLKTNFNQGYRIQWFKDNVLLSNFNDSTINVLQGGIYWSQLTNGAACSDTSNQAISRR